MMEDLTDGCWLTLNMVGGYKPRNVGSSRGWKKQGNGFYPRVTRKNAAVLPMGFNYWLVHYGFIGTEE